MYAENRIQCAGERLPLAKSKGVRREAESEGSWRQMHDPRYTQVMDPIFDVDFSRHRYGFRLGKRAHDAVIRIASAKGHCEKFDQWIRRRLHMCLWKQWKRVRTRIHELRALGVPEWAGFVMANSRRGAWEMSRNTNNALPTSYWEAKALKILLTRYLELC
ncbi:RNA-directed DNA polymerase [Paenibacillus sp. FSL R7-269]|nr:RNA-directed DNA polymerase [Paenibacillus sp. FSL R7-269]